MRPLTALALLLFAAVPAMADVKTDTVNYTDGATTFQGVLAYDDAVKEKRPGVLVVHEWWGLNDYAKGRAQELAKMGYVAFACDMYGNGKQVEHPKDAGAMAGEVRKDVKAWRAKAAAALNVLAGSDKVNKDKLAAIGYCFGGSTALQLAYSGADLKAVAVFHAGLPDVTADEAKAIKAKVLVCHGADDKFIPAESITKFKVALQEAKVALQFEVYPDSVHGFTVPDADAKKVPGLAYNAQADTKSWAAMRALFEATIPLK